MEAIKGTTARTNYPLEATKKTAKVEASTHHRPMVSLLVAVLWFGWRTFKRLALIAIALTLLAVLLIGVEDLSRFIRTPEEIPTEANKILGEAESFLDSMAESLAATPIIIRYPNGAQLDEATIEQWVVHYTNEERRAAGLVELSHDVSISDFARSHSEQMIQYGYGHIVLGMGPTDRALSRATNAVFYRWTAQSATE